MTTEEIVSDIRRQLDWRGPTGQPQGHVVLPRKDADHLLVTVEMLLKLHREMLSKLREEETR